MAKLQSLPTRITTLDTRSAKPPPKTAEPFYLSPQWRSFIEGLKRKRGSKCEECGRTNTRIFGDHIIECKDGGAELAETNVKLLCGSCHTEKTNRERAKRHGRSDL